ncbi:MAG: cation:proton antiporter, partial [bacterium]|nr:cation:proton antiporter [bacterium]
MEGLMGFARLGIFLFCMLGIAEATASADTGAGHGGAGISPAASFLMLIVLLLCARMGALVERLKQPAVLGELLMGMALAALSVVPAFHLLGTAKHDPLIAFIAEVGVFLLLFETGLESDLNTLLTVGGRAFLVAIIGVILPFAGGYVLSSLLFTEFGWHTHLFVGATLTATSVGITGRVFKDLGFARIEKEIVLGAAVIDDVLGLIILAVVSALVAGTNVTALGISWLFVKAALFLAGAIGIGVMAAPRLGAVFSWFHNGHGMKTALSLLFCAVFAFAAEKLVGLAPIVGAFAAGLLLDPVHFKNFEAPALVVRLREWAEKLRVLKLVSIERSFDIGPAIRMKDDGPVYGRVIGISADTEDNPELARISREIRETADEEEHGHVENLVRGISIFFVPIFFVFTGLQVDFAAFAKPSVLGIALLISLVAFVGKILCGIAAGRKADWLTVGIAMVPRGEVGLIFANIGRVLGVVNGDIFAVLLIVITLSTLATPPLLAWQIKRSSRYMAGE